MILYFSGTGNSQYLAESLAKEIDDTALDLFSYIKSNQKEIFNSDKAFVLITPTYSWRVPRFIIKYLNKCEFTGSKDMYVILNYGSSSGNAYKYIKEDVKSWGLNFMGVYGIKMPENYIMLFNLDDAETNKNIVLDATKEISKIADIINNKDQFKKGKINLIDRFISGPVNSFFFKFMVKDKKFYYTEKCIKCSKCSQVCVLNNIDYVDGYPRWNGNCTHCAACISKCPTGSIEYGKKTVGKDRYLLNKIIKNN